MPLVPEVAEPLSKADIVDPLQIVADFDGKALEVLKLWTTLRSSDVIVKILEEKRFHGPRIWTLYKLCGEDIGRFDYHVVYELPNQETGIFMIVGPLEPDFAVDIDFWSRRRFGSPGSFWALKRAPRRKCYRYPIIRRTRK